MTAAAANIEGKVGPNAVTQVAAALRAVGGDALASQVFLAANMVDVLATPPVRMIDQDVAAQLHEALRLSLPRKDAQQIAADAGRRTAGYLLANRIPKPAQMLMKILPAPLSARILLKAMAANAWTYAGSGRVETRATPCTIEIIENPLAQPGCPWHVAVFERLFQTLVTPNATVAHTACCANGALACRFEINLRKTA